MEMAVLLPFQLFHSEDLNYYQNHLPFPASRTDLILYNTQTWWLIAVMPSTNIWTHNGKLVPSLWELGCKPEWKAWRASASQPQTEKWNGRVFSEVRRESDKIWKLNFKEHSPAIKVVVNLEFLYWENDRARDIEYRIFKKQLANTLN